jgi:hypothetical protein
MRGLKALGEHADLLPQLIEPGFHVGDIPSLPLQLSLHELSWLGLCHLLRHLHLHELTIHALHVVTKNSHVALRRTCRES